MSQRLPALVCSVLVVVLSAGTLFGCQKAPADKLVRAPPLSKPTTDPFGPGAVVQSAIARATAPSRPVGPNRGDDRRAEIQRVAQGLFDFREMARRSLGQHWPALSPQEQHEFVRVFTDVLKPVVVAIVERSSGERRAFLADEVAGGYARVHSRVTPRAGPEISIVSRLFESGSRWAVYDVVVDSRSLVSTYRSQLDSITRNSFDSQRFTGELLAPSVHERGAAGLLLGAALYGRRR